MLEEQKPKLKPSDFFLYLSILITLYVSTIALMVFLFTSIDLIFPSRFNAYTYPTDSIAWSLSVFIVFYPVMIYLLTLSRKSIIQEPIKASLTIRKWFIYLTMFLTGLTVAIDLIVVINRYLGGGDLTTGFLLKVLATLIVAGSIFMFSRTDLRGVFISNKKMFNAFRTIATIVILVLIVAGVVLMGSPKDLRNQSDDRQRVEDLSVIQSEIINFWQSKKRLPVSLEELNDPLVFYEAKTDPETGESYEYKALGDLTFELCATFKTDPSDQSYVDRKFNENSFNYVPGRNCFERTIDPDKFSPLEKVY